MDNDATADAPEPKADSFGRSNAVDDHWLGILTFGQLKVLRIYLRRLNKDGVAWPGRLSIARAIGLRVRPDWEPGQDARARQTWEQERVKSEQNAAGVVSGYIRDLKSYGLLVLLRRKKIVKEGIVVSVIVYYRMPEAEEIIKRAAEARQKIEAARREADAARVGSAPPARVGSAPPARVGSAPPARVGSAPPITAQGTAQGTVQVTAQQTAAARARPHPQSHALENENDHEPIQEKKLAKTKEQIDADFARLKEVGVKGKLLRLIAERVPSDELSVIGQEVDNVFFSQERESTEYKSEQEYYAAYLVIAILKEFPELKKRSRGNASHISQLLPAIVRTDQEMREATQIAHAPKAREAAQQLFKIKAEAQA